MTETPTADSVAEHGLHTLEILVDAGDFEMAGIMYDLTAENIGICCDMRQETRLRSVGDVLGKPKLAAGAPTFG